MDNALTPNKIKRLMYIAEDKSYVSQVSQQMTPMDDEAVKRSSGVAASQQGAAYESSSGLLDLDQIEAFESYGESAAGSDCLRVPTSFCPAEMTGRSTGADDIVNRSMPLGHHTRVINALQNEMDKQSYEVNNLIRHSICNSTAYSFQSKRDLTADEVSLVMREAPLPVMHSTQAHFTDTTMNTNTSAMSVGAYFQRRCSGLEAVLGKVPESPDRSGYSMPSITEVTPKTKYPIDETLDSVPVRQSRLERVPEKNLKSNVSKNYEKQTFVAPAPKETNIKSNDTYNKDAGLNYSSISKAPESFAVPLNPLASSSFASVRQMSSKPTDILLRNMNADLRLTSEHTEESACQTENSISLSKIADFLGKESNVSVSAILKYNNRNKQPAKKKPLTELHMNLQEGNLSERNDTKVTNLRDSRKTDAGSSAGTLSTVISLDKLTLQEKKIPEIVVSSLADKEQEVGKETKRSKSPSSKSQSSLSTVHENCPSFKSGDSPLQNSKGDTSSRILSPNVVYRELDKSVDWRDVLQQKLLKQHGLLKEQWAEIEANAAIGFVGVCCSVNYNVTNLTDSWLTATLKFDQLPNNGQDINIELPRLPLLLSPGKTEKFTFNITSNIELDTDIPFTMRFNDASIDGDIEQSGTFHVLIKMPMIQAMSCDGVNKVTFPPIQEKSSLIKSFVLLSDCSVDLQLELAIAEGDSIFSIKSVQEISKSDVNKVLMDRQASVEEIQHGKVKTKGMNKQICRLSSGNAIKLQVKINAPKLCDLQIKENIASLSGALHVNMYGVAAVLRRVDLVGTVGVVNLVVNVPDKKLHVTKEPSHITLTNSGSVPGVWIVKVANTSTDSFPFKVGPAKFDIRPGATRSVTLFYTGAADEQCTATLVFEDLITYHKTALEISGGSECKSFPIRTNHGVLSYVRAGRKEISLKNATNKKIHIRVCVDGEGFSLDLPGMEAKGVYYMTFAPAECRPLPILFSPVSNVPQVGNLHLVYDKNSEVSRSVRLFGSSSGEALRWSGLVTYGDTALVRAVSRAPVRLDLYNKSYMPAFLSANVHFNLQYKAVSASARLAGSSCVVAGRARHALTLCVEWARVERRARDATTATLATVTLLTGAELTRRRILKVIRDESTGVLDTSLLDDHLKVLVGPFQGEDHSMDDMIADFKETKESLNELIGGLHELTAQIVLPQDFADENTIVITDDTVVEHHTLCD